MSMIHRHKQQQAARRAAIAESVKQADTENKSPYTKTDIYRMNKDDLVSLADEIGISGAEELNGAKLKELLIKHFNL